MIDFTPAIDDPEKDARTIRNNFFRELGERDRDANQDGRPNIFTIAEIRDRSLGAFSLDTVRSHVRSYFMEEEPKIEFVDNINDDLIRLTNAGRFKIVLLTYVS